MGSFYLLNLGCKVNQYEGQCIREALVKDGQFLSSTPEMADLIIINGCAVTLRAEKKSVSLALLYKRMGKSVVLTGCAGQALFNLGKALDGIEIVPQQRKLEFFQAKEKVSYLLGHHRAFVKLQDGCSFSCSYCYIPKLRGPSRVRDELSIKEDIQALAQRGYKEIIFTGICLGWGGQDIVSLARFARSVGIPRVRLSSVEPCFVSSDIVAGIKDGILCPHLHIPFQSGSDSVLRRMNRGYSSEFYEVLVDRVRKKIPDVAISTDIMVGFPGESEVEFTETLSFLEKVRPMRIHVFPYSPRPGTEAEKMDGQVPNRVKKERVKKVIELGRKLFEEYKERMNGKILKVLVIEKQGNFWSGISENYLRVEFVSSERCLGEIIEVEVDNKVSVEPV